jgi:hypothetical protein
VKVSGEQGKQVVSQPRDASRAIPPTLSGYSHIDWALWHLSLVLAEIACQRLGPESVNSYGRYVGVARSVKGEKGREGC